MAGRLTFKYDQATDVLYVGTCASYPEQESSELGDEVIARLNPRTGEIENLELLFFSARLAGGEALELPVIADFRLANRAS